MMQLLTIKALNLLKKGRIIEAKKLWYHAVKTNPRDEDAWFGLLNALELSLTQSQLSQLNDLFDYEEQISDFPIVMEQLSDMYAKNGIIDKSIEIIQTSAMSKPLNSRQLDKLFTRSLVLGDKEFIPLIEMLASQRERITNPELLLSIASYLIMENRVKEISRVLIQFLQVIDNRRIDLLARAASMLKNSIFFPNRDLVVNQLIQKAISIAEISEGFYYHEQLARFCLAEGFLQEALLLLEVVRQRGFESAEIWEDIGDLFTLMGEGDPIAVYQQALELNPFNVRLIVKYVDLLMEEGGLEAAIDVLEEAKSRRIDEKEIFVKLAQCRLLLGDPVGAWETLHHRMLDHSEDRVIQEILTEIYLRLGNPLKAAKNAVNLLKTSSTDVDSLDKTIKMWRILAESLEELKLWDQALVVYDFLTDLIPEDMNLWLSKIGVFIELNQYETALSILKTLARQYPEDDEIWRRLGQCSVLVGDLASSKKYLETALALNPNNHLVLVELGKIHEKNGDVNQARRCYEKSVRLRPNNIVAWLRLVMLDIIEEDALVALPKLRKILAIDPNNTFVIQLLAQVLIQELARNHQKKIRQDALQRFILEIISPLTPNLQAVLPNYLLEMGFKQVALQVTSILHRHYPDEPMIILAHAAALISNGKQVADANAMLHHLLEKYPYLAELNFWLGKYELSQQNYEDAVNYLTVARHLDPSNEKYWDEELWARAMSSCKLTSLIPLMEHVQRVFPNGTRLMVTMAMIYYMYHHFDESESLLEKCIDKNPKLVKAWILIARIKKIKGSLLDAVATILKGLEHNANNVELLEELQRIENDTSWNITSVKSMNVEGEGHYHELLTHLQKYHQDHGFASLNELRELIAMKDFETVEKIVLNHLPEVTTVEMKLFLFQVMARVKILQYQLKDALKFIDLSYCLQLLSEESNDLLISVIEMLEIENDSLRLLREAVTLFNLPRREWMESLFTDLKSPLMELKNLFQNVQNCLRSDVSDALTWLFLALMFRTFQLHESSKHAFMRALMLEFPEDEGTIRLFLFLKESVDLK